VKVPSGTNVKAPIALVEKFREVRNVQLGLPESALVVLQTPPPAAPTQSRQKPALQPVAVSSTSAVMRPETVVAAPEKVRILGSNAKNGPVGLQVLNRGASGGCFLFFFESLPFVAGAGVALLAERARKLLTPTTAFSCAVKGVSSAG
jgi:hypothetical protein